MKRYINYLMAISGISLMLFFSSCLKNSQYYTDLSAVGSSIDMPLAAANGNQPFTLTFTPADTPSHFYVYVNVASPQKLGKAINATLGLDTAYLTQYNASNGTSYEVLPDSDYTLSTMNLTVPAHQRLASSVLAIYTNKIDAAHNYVLPLTIIKADLPIENWNHLLINVAVKNQYDGNYGLVIRTTGWSAYGISDNQEGTWPVNSDGTSIGMVTSGTSSVKMYIYGAGYGQPTFTAGNAGTSYFGNTAPEFTFDPNTNLLLSVVNKAYPIDSRNRQFQINSAVTDSRYDPSTKTIYAAYIMTQNGRPPQYIYDTLTYIGARP